MAEGDKDDLAEKLRRDEIRLLESLKKMVSTDTEWDEVKLVQLQMERWFSGKYETTDQDRINWFTKARSILDARFIRTQRKDAIREIVLYDDPRITARVKSSVEKKLDNIKAEPLSNRDRTELLTGRTPSSLSGMQYISDIYRINGGFNFTDPCSVSIQLKWKYNEKTNDLMAVVSDNEKWTEIPAILENDYAVFGLRSMDCVYVVTVPKATEAEVTEDGYQFSSDVDERICLSVPEKAVDQPTSISIKVLLPDGKVAEKVQQIRDKYNIVAISPCLCVEYKVPCNLKKRVTVTMPLNQPPNSQNCEVILLTLEEDTVSRVKTTVRSGPNNAVSSDVPSPKIQVFALVKKTADVKLIYEEVLLHLDLARYYKVLSFRDPKKLRGFLIECTPMEKVQQVIDERKKEGYVLERNGGQSNPLVLRQEQRLRIALSGNIEQDISIPKFAYFITMLFSAQDQKTVFPYKLKSSVGGTHFGTLTISSDNFKRGELCSVHFDPEFMIGK